MSVTLFQFEYGFGWFAEVSCDLQHQYGGGNVAARFDGIDSLPAHAHGRGKLLLGDVLYRPFNPDCILHKLSLLMAFMVKLNLRI